jgi:putative membrane protein
VDPDHRWPRSVFGVGTEPDPRLSFANERTFLAWIRTALALLAAGVALDSLTVSLDRHLVRAVAVLLTLGGLVGAGSAWFRWVKAERAMRSRDPLPAPTFAAPLALVVVVVGVAVLSGILR